MTMAPAGPIVESAQNGQEGTIQCKIKKPNTPQKVS